MKRRTILPALLTALGASFAATAIPAHAAVSSASINGKTATLSLDGADDNVTVSVSGGLLVHGQTTGGLNSGSDWNSAMNGDQTVPADGTFTVVVNGGDGHDAVTVLAKTTEIAGTTLNGDGGDDVLTGADTNDTLNGGDGNDRITGFKANDQVFGGNGNDVMIWNNGDGNDANDGGNGVDTALVTSGAADDVMNVTATGGARTASRAPTLRSAST